MLGVERNFVFLGPGALLLGWCSVEPVQARMPCSVCLPGGRKHHPPLRRCSQKIHFLLTFWHVFPCAYFLADKAQFKLMHMGKNAKKGEADRHIPDLKPKHLFSGKRPRGTADRR